MSTPPPSKVNNVSPSRSATLEDRLIAAALPLHAVRARGEA